MSDYRNRQVANSGKKGRRRRRKVRARFFVIILALAAACLGVVYGIKLLGEKPAEDPNAPVTTAMPGYTGQTVQTTLAPGNPMTVVGQSQQTISQLLGGEDNDLRGLTADQLVQVEDLHINPNLPSQWMNVLLLGADARDLNETCRTDTIMICSINTDTGAVKLTSIARDTAVYYSDIGEYSGTYRINAANFFGGPELAMKTINEKLDMNIEYYVLVNFYGFEYIVENMGGVDINITEAEKDEINTHQYAQWEVEEKIGYDDSLLEKHWLQDDEYGENTHLNGRQALAYTRIRKLDSDFSRTERQRTVLIKLLDKLKEKSATELTSLALSMQQFFQTNLSLDKILNVAFTVLGSDVGSVKQLRLPVNGTYALETRNEQSMLYDCDWTKNTLELYNFIYE